MSVDGAADGGLLGGRAAEGEGGGLEEEEAVASRSGRVNLGGLCGCVSRN